MRVRRFSLGAAVVAAVSVLGCGMVLGINDDFSVQCHAAADCDDGDPCTDDACGADGLCGHSPGTGAPCTGDEGPGTCAAGVCVPLCGGAPACDDKNDCTEDRCEAATNTCVHDGSKLGGAACGPMSQLKCDGDGHCIQCMDPSQCGADDECNTFTCEASVCGRNVARSGKVLADQADGDCKSKRCDGMGSVVIVADDLDRPDDSNDCTFEACAGGTPLYLNQPLGTPCVSAIGDGICDGKGTCRKDFGTACSGAIECASGLCVDGVCCDAPCTDICYSCAKAGSVGTCTMLSKNQKDSFPANACNGVMACDGAGGCKKQRASLCSAASECADGFCVDGRCCNSSCATVCKACDVPGIEGTCSDAPQLSQDNYPVGACVGNKACNGAGACKKANGQSCSVGTDCASGVCGGGPPTICM